MELTSSQIPIEAMSVIHTSEELDVEDMVSQGNISQYMAWYEGMLDNGQVRHKSITTFPRIFLLFFHRILVLTSLDQLYYHLNLLWWTALKLFKMISLQKRGLLSYYYYVTL